MKIPGLSAFKDKHGDTIELYASGSGNCMVSFRDEKGMVASTHINTLEELQRFAAAVEEFIEDASEVLCKQQEKKG